MNRYINNISACRMALIENYFDPESKPQNCMKCDICTGYTRAPVHLPGTIFLNI